MKVLHVNGKNFKAIAGDVAATSSLFDPDVETRTREIIEAVARRGEQALLDFTQRFDGASLVSHQLKVGRNEIGRAARRVDRDLKSALAAAVENVAEFARRSVRTDWKTRNREGAEVGEKYDPFQRVGIYVPGGTAPLVSTAVMTVTLARVAGCPEIVVCTPCNRLGEINPNLLYALREGGATEIFRVGGGQAVAGMALGTKSIRPVQKIFGPGNAYVVAAKRLLVGHVAIDLLPGPSELLVLADDSARPEFVAADLLAQAEHGSTHERVFLVSTSKPLLRAVQEEIWRQLPALSRRRFIEPTLNRNAVLMHAASMKIAVAMANHIAPEHCEVMTRHAAVVSRDIVTAGALFLGDWSPTCMGDYLAGPSHVLPTGGAGASFAGLTVDQFQRRTSVVTYSKTALKKSLPALEILAGREGLDAHARSGAIRFNQRR